MLFFSNFEAHHHNYCVYAEAHTLIILMLNFKCLYLPTATYPNTSETTFIIHPFLKSVESLLFILDNEIAT